MLDARPAFRWEPTPYRRHPSDEFADIPSIGRYRVKRAKNHANFYVFDLLLDGKRLGAGNTVAEAKSLAESDAARRALSGDKDKDNG